MFFIWNSVFCLQKQTSYPTQSGTLQPVNISYNICLVFDFRFVRVTPFRSSWRMLKDHMPGKLVCDGKVN